MPKIGEIRRAKELGIKTNNSRYIWCVCVDCQKGAWIRLAKKTLERKRCDNCSHQFLRGTNAPNWKGGRQVCRGYFLVTIQPEDPFYSMTRKGRVLEHRLIVARALGRCLRLGEIVHHKGDKYPMGSIENKQDNRYPENLELTSSSLHGKIPWKEFQELKKECQLQNQLIKDLTTEVRLLRWEIREGAKNETQR